MNFITVNSIGGSIWSFNRDHILVVSKRSISTFTNEQLNNIPELKDMESCAIIRLVGESSEYMCKDSYESIMAQLNDENE